MNAISNSEKGTKNFKVEEFTCHCGCGFNIINQKLIELCQKIRDEIGIAIRVNSGCRCRKYNAKVSKVKNSNHVKGLAADLSCSEGASVIWAAVHALHERKEIPELSWACLYPYKNFVHVDIGRKRDKIFATDYSR